MARPLRIEYPGAVYHVMARGNQGRPIFQDDQDRLRFLETVGEACQKTGWRIHAYVLMNNHYHLLLETPEGNLVAGMKWLQGIYTQRFNRRHKISGHLFQGRYKAVVIDGDSPGYFDTVVTYIHLNPVRANLIVAGQQPLRSYPWSSHRWYVKSPGKGSAWLSRQRVMSALGLEIDHGQRYEKYIEARALELGLKVGRQELDEKWKALRRGWYMGQESFGEKLRRRLGKIVAGRKRESHSGGACRAHGEAAARDLLAEGLKTIGMSEAELRNLPKAAGEKGVLAWWLRQQTSVSLRWVGETLAMGHYTRVTQAVSRVRNRPTKRLLALKKRLLQAHEQEGNNK